MYSKEFKSIWRQISKLQLSLGDSWRDSESPGFRRSVQGGFFSDKIYEELVSRYRRVIELSPEDEKATYLGSLAALQFDAMDFKGFLHASIRVLSLKGGFDPMTLSLLASFHALHGECREAENICSRIRSVESAQSFAPSERDLFRYTSIGMDLQISSRLSASPGLDDEETQEALDFSRAFGEHLLEREYAVAADFLTDGLRNELGPESLEKRIKLLGECAGGRLTSCEPMQYLVDWPGKLVGDVAWVYLALSSKHSSEGAVFVVRREDEGLKIRSIDWGRP